MMHRSKKLLGTGDREYFNEKGPVNVRVDGTAHRSEALGSCHERGSRRSERDLHKAVPHFLQPDF
jgi:hypothetical protein